MPKFPQYQEALLVEGANWQTNTGTKTSVATLANTGDVWVYNGGTAGQSLVLPEVTLGGPVTVVNIHATGTVIVTPAVADTSATVNGGASYTVPAGGTGAAATKATFYSDGANWFTTS